MNTKYRILPLLHALTVLTAGSAGAQDLSLGVAEAYQPRLQDLFFPSEGLIKGGFAYSVGLETIYDSNFFLDEEDEQDELYFVLSPVITYTSDPEGGALLSFEAEYSPLFKGYTEETDRSGIDQRFRGSLTYTGGRLNATAYASYEEISGADRLAEDYIEGSLVRYGVYGSYQVASRTSIGLNIGASHSEYDTGEKGADTFRIGLSADWAYSERLSFGPYLRYSMTESVTSGSRDSYAVMFQAKYRFEERIRLSAALGLEKSSNSRSGEGDGDIRVTGDLTAKYQVTERLTWSGSIRYATVPSPSTEDYFVQDLTVSTKLTRELEQGSVSLGLRWSSAYYDETGDVTTEHDDDKYTSVILSHSRNLLSDRATLDSSVSYAFSEGEREYDRWQIAVGIRVTF